MNPFEMTSGLEGKEQSKFADWLNQYESLLKIDAWFENHPEFLKAEDATEDTEHLKSLAKPSFYPPKPGQIRLLHQCVLSDQESIAPIIILSQWEGDQRWLVAPFSPLTKPANPGELETDLEYHAYRVVEAWNAFVIPEFLLYTETSFLREAGEAIRLDACKVFFAHLKGTTLPEELADKCGPRIMSKFDPRIQYLLSEQEQYQPLLQMVHAWDESTNDMENQQFEAAAGENYLSHGYIRKDGELIPLKNGIKVESDFLPVLAKETLPHYTWYMDDLPEGLVSGMTVYFQTVKQKVLGKGVLEGNQAEGYEVSLQETIAPQETPSIESPADIILVFCKE